MVTGAAPISPDVMDFLRIVFGCQVMEGYGQSEASAAICITSAYDYTTGHVGPPLGGCANGPGSHPFLRRAGVALG